MDSRSAGILIAAAGVLLVLVGVLVWSGALGWLGRLPGDLRFGEGGTRVYVPLASMLVVSLALSLLVTILRRFL